MVFNSLQDYIYERYGPLAKYNCFVLDLLYNIYHLFNTKLRGNDPNQYPIFLGFSPSTLIPSSTYYNNKFYFPRSVTTLLLAPSLFNFDPSLTFPDYYYIKIGSDSYKYNELYNIIKRYTWSVPNALVFIPNESDSVLSPSISDTAIDYVNIWQIGDEEHQYIDQLLDVIENPPSSASFPLSSISLADATNLINSLSSNLSKLCLIDILLQIDNVSVAYELLHNLVPYIEFDSSLLIQAYYMRIAADIASTFNKT